MANITSTSYDHPTYQEFFVVRLRFWPMNFAARDFSFRTRCEDIAVRCNCIANLAQPAWSFGAHTFDASIFEFDAVIDFVGTRLSEAYCFCIWMRHFVWWLSREIGRAVMECA